MAGFNHPELEAFAGTDKSSSHVMESIGDSNVDKSNDDSSPMHFHANWPMAVGGVNNAAVPTQFTIIFNGSTFVYDGVPAEKVQEIMLIAAAYAKSAEVKVGTESSFTPLIPTTPSSPLRNSNNNLPSQQSVCFSLEKNSICRLQEFPLARRQSLQRFLEKRRVRLCSKGPYGGATSKKVSGNIENTFFGNNAPDLGSFKQSKDGFHASIAAT